MSLPLARFQEALVAHLGASADLIGLIGAKRVFDKVPADIVPPYVVVVRIDLVEDGTTCTPNDEWRLSAEVAIFDRKVGKPFSHRISEAVHEAMKEPFPVAGFLNNCAIMSGSTHSTDSDGLTASASMTYTYLIERA